MASVENFDRGSKCRAITSPRSLEACRLNGVEAQELLPKSMESFAVGGVPQNMVQRRAQHAEQRRQKTVNLVRQTRQELMNGGGENSPSTPRRRADRQFSESPSRTTASRNKVNQIQSLQALNEERRQRNDAKMDQLEHSTRTALESKSNHLNSIRDQGTQRWESVWSTHDKADNLNAERSQERMQRHSSKEEMRRSGSAAASQRRSESWKNTGEQREAHREGVRGNYNNELDQYRSRKEGWMQDVFEKQDHAAQHKEDTREYYQEVGGKRQLGRDQAKDRATMTEAERHRFYQELLIRKQAIMEDQALTAEERKRHIAELFSKKNMQHMTVVERGVQVTAQHRSYLMGKMTDKEAVAAEVKASLMMAQLETIERKREANMDHVEDITRSRKSTDYKRQKRFSEKVEECAYGHYSPPKQ